MTERMSAFIARYEQQEWVCPNPVHWDALWKLLSQHRGHGDRSMPPAPLILDGWVFSDDGQKRARFLEHLAWADEHAETDSVFNLIESLSPADWHRA
jgi:hypothetical protein